MRNLKLTALVALTMAILVWRRSDQFTHPYIWMEESWMLREYASDGLSAVFGTVNGFPQLVARVLAVTSYKVAIFAAPEIGVALASAFTCFVVVSIALAPTYLRWPYACAAATLVIPTGAENYATVIVTFWWAGLLLPLALLWREQRQGWRLFFIALGGLSSPIIMVLSVLFVVRALVERTRCEWIAAACACACAATMAATLLTTHAARSPPFGPAMRELMHFVSKFAGWFVSGSFAFNDRALAMTAIGAVLMLIPLYLIRERLDRHFALLVAAYALISVTTAMRVEPTALNAFEAGPRYLFYPFILIAWALIWIAAETSRWAKAGAIGILVFGIVQGFTHPSFSWGHDRFDWPDILRKCAASDNYHIPIPYAGGPASSPVRSILWQEKFTGEQCRQLIARSLL